MEIDLPRMQSLSPRFDSSESIDSEPEMTSLSLRDIPTPTPTHTPTTVEPDSSSLTMDDAKNCDWKYGSDFCGCNKSGCCGCKYINKVSSLVYDWMFKFERKYYTLFVITVLCKLTDDSYSLKWIFHFVRFKTSRRHWTFGCRHFIRIKCVLLQLNVTSNSLFCSLFINILSRKCSRRSSLSLHSLRFQLKMSAFVYL